MYARTAVPVCRDSQINVVGGENRQNIFAFWFPSSYCPVLWPRVCMGVWPALADHRYSKTYQVYTSKYVYIHV